jgi:peptidoglycan hydrolase-like protein with peptidoglycan-binding domain
MSRGLSVRRGRRTSAVALLGSALLVGSLLVPPAIAQDDDDGGDDSSTAGQGAPPPGEEKPRTSGGHGYGGRALGPAPLQVLPPDPAYPVPAPPVNDSLPEEVDVSPPWQENVVCDPFDKPGLEAFANLVGAHYSRPGYTTSRSCIDLKSEHYDGRAIDWQLDAYDPADRRVGDAVAQWLTDNDGEMARRFGIQSVIWNQRVWHAYNDGGWRGYVGQSPHTDHIHFSFTWDGAMMRTSWWTGVAVEQPDLGPCKTISGAYAAIPAAPRYEPCVPTLVSVEHTGYADVRPGGQGAGVSLLQEALKLPETGTLDVDTREALLAWQTEQELPATGVADQLTYAALLGWELPELPDQALAVELPEYATTPFTPFKRTVLKEDDQGDAVMLLQDALGIEADGDFGPKTKKALEEFTAEHPLLTDSAETTALTWHLLEQAAYPTLAYRHVELEVGSEGFAVKVLQQQLDLEADGKFGPVTEEAVRQVQADAGLEPTGVVDGPTWAAADRGKGVGVLGFGRDVDELGRTWADGSIVHDESDLPSADE